LPTIIRSIPPTRTTATSECALEVGSISIEDIVRAEKGVDKRAMAILSAGHLFTDVNQGAVAALVPLLVAERGLSLTAAGFLVLAPP
jgi:hypothetical protein